MNEIKTTDLYLAAYLLQSNIPAKEILIEGTPKKKAVFVFEITTHLHSHIEQFQQNKAKVNVRDYAYFLERAKDVMYVALRGGAL